MRLLIGGYGGKSGDTAGVYDLAERRFIWRSGIESISYMCTGEKLGGLDLFFGAGEHDGYGMVYMFTKESGGYTLVDSRRVEGGGLCHIAYSPTHKILTGAHYQTGDVFSVAVRVNISRPSFGEIKTHTRQGGAEGKRTRAHCAVIDGDLVYSANISLDRVYQYSIVDGELIAEGYVPLTPGTGPRHLMVRNGLLYVITEYSNEILMIPLGNGFLCSKALVFSSFSALPETFIGESYCSAMAVRGGLLYAANRGANTIAVFKFTNDGTLEKLFNCPCGGNWPRDISIINSADSGLLAVANERSGEVVIFSVLHNGAIGEAVEKIPFEGVSFVMQCG